MSMQKFTESGLPKLFDLSSSAHARLFSYLTWPWEALTSLDTYLGMLLAEDPLGSESQVDRLGVSISGDVRIGQRTKIEPGVHIEGIVHIGDGCLIESGAYIRGPAWIGNGCELRQGVYLRGVVLVGAGSVLGHACEFKRCILLEGAQAPHFNYVGDSILGIKAHIGAGVILSNVRLDGRPVRALKAEAPGMSPSYIDTGLSKFGALIGDHCEIGCNSVLNPGTIIGARSHIAPLSNVKGTWSEDSRIS